MSSAMFWPRLTPEMTRSGFSPITSLKRHDDAIGRRAAHGEAPLAGLAEADRIGERQRMRDAGIVHLRRHDPDVVGKLSRDPLGGIEARRVDAVVVGDEDFHGA